MTYTWTPDDYQTLASLAAAHGILATEVAKVFLEESGLDPSNPGPSGASPPVGGLNQMASTNLGSISRAQWLAMTAAAQLPVIFQFWTGSLPKGQFPSDAGTLLALNFLPGQFKVAGALTNENAVLAGKSGPYASYYTDNISLDPNKTGAITPATCNTRLAQVAASSAKWPAFTAQLAKYAPGVGAVASASSGSSGAKWAWAIVGGLAVGGAIYLAMEEAPRMRAAGRSARRAGPRRRIAA